MFEDKMTRVLVTSCSSGIGQEIYHSLSHRRDIVLYGINSSENTPGKVLYGKLSYTGCPLLSDRAQFIQYVKHFCDLHEIKYIFPARDDDIVALKENEHEIGVTVITSPLETCVIARRKSITYETLGEVIRVPRIFKLEEIQEVDFPVFLKPDRGAGSIGCKKIDNSEELLSVYDRERDIICEVLPGKEYTVDCLTGKNGELFYHCPRERTIARSGISIVTSRVEDSRVLDEVKEMALRINDTIEFTGEWFFQVKHASDGSLCLLEIAPRIAGAMAFSRASGVNLPLLSLNMHMGLPVEVPDFHPPERTMKVYRNYIDPPLKVENFAVDLDDTLVIKGKVNPEAMACLYRQKNQGVAIHLVTRRPTSIIGYLRRFHIPETIFTSIKQIFDLSKKSLYIVPGSVFVDDSFKERQEVASSGKNIRVFDVDSFEYL